MPRTKKKLPKPDCTMRCGLHFNHTGGEHLTSCPVYSWEHPSPAPKAIRRHAIASLSETSRVMKLARSYAELDKVDGIHDLNAAIDLAKALLRWTAR